MFKKSFIAISALALIVASQVVADENCPQPRQTKAQAADIVALKNPKTSPDDVKAGEALFQKDAKPVVCHMCHGKTGEGNGPAGKAFKAPVSPRNFACGAMMKDIADGQMFGTIKNGSPGTGMIAHSKTLTDDQIWQLVSYLRTLAK